MRAAALDLERQRLAGAGAHDLLHIGEALDRSSVDRKDQVAGLEAGRLGGAARLNGVDPGRHIRLAKDHEECSENSYGQYEICRRAGHDDGRSASDRLMNEAVLALLRAHGSNRRLVGNARRIIVAEEFYVAAKWNGAQLPSRVMAVVEAKKLRTETDGEHQHPDAAPARHQKMTKLVEEHHDGQNEQERYEIAQHATTQRVDPRQKTEIHEFSSYPVPKPCPTSPEALSERTILGCLYGNFGQKIAGQQSCIMVNK